MLNNETSFHDVEYIASLRLRANGLKNRKMTLIISVRQQDPTNFSLELILGL